MDDSRSSDLLSESIDVFYCSSNAESTNIINASYGLMVSNTKSTFTTLRKEVTKSVFPSCFSNLLYDCSMCISQSLEFVTDLLNETNMNTSQLKEYMNDAICILQMLSDFIKHIIESISMSCCTMKQFPIVTGQIIMTVFTHCKESESIYGNQLNSVEKQIKDLFRSCHELQLTYLLVLEKHFIFNLTDKEELDILIEALHLNLKIGEIVQNLDVKTMAEQWKAYTVICEKYSDTLLDKQIYRDCTNVLCAMISNSIKIALEENEEKVTLRSLKVSSFTLKILLRISITFKSATVKDYSNVVELLLFVNLNNESYLEAMHRKNSQFIDMYNSNIMTPVNNFVAELLHDESFLQGVCDYNVENIKNDDKLLGLINLVISIIRCILQKDCSALKLQKYQLVNVIYSILPYGHVWFNMGLKYKCKDSSGLYESYGLYEHLITHIVATISMMGIEEFHILEKRMLESIFSSDCLSAMFSSNLWTLLARTSSRQLLLAQVVSLCKIYQKLEKNSQFIDSPQCVHLRHTLCRLFEVMANEDKMKIYSLFNIYDDKNMEIWRCLKINNLPNELLFNTEEFAVQKFQFQVQRLTINQNVDVDILIKSIHLVNTCSISQNENIKMSLIKAWSKACPKIITCEITQLDRGTLWYYKYIEALVALTESMEHIFHKNVDLVKVLHVVSNIICAACREFKILLINILCKLANLEVNDANKHLADSILTRTFHDLFTCIDPVVRNKLFDAFRIFKTNNLYRILFNVVNKDESLREPWTYFIRHGRLERSGDSDLKDQLQSVMAMAYFHKCMEIGDELKDSGSLVEQRCLSNNFNIDIDMLFENESDEEPACKKTKLNADEAEEIISQLEKNTSLLCNVKENVFSLETKNRIKTICNKLSNILN